MTMAREFWLVAAAYSVGCANAAYYLVRLRTGRDVRAEGSGTAGARNAGRVLGRGWFLAAFLLDAAKGAGVVLATRALGASEACTALALLAAVAGHVWPLQLGFRGGKGVSSAVGGLVALTPWAVPALVVPFLPVWALVRRFTPAGLAAFAAAPLVLWGIERDAAQAWTAAAAAALVLFAHRPSDRASDVRPAPAGGPPAVGPPAGGPPAGGLH